MAGIGDYEKGKKFTLKSGNTTPFKQMGSSPLKQAIGGGAGEALAHWKKYKEGLKKIIPGDAINKELTRIAKGGTPKAKQIASKKITTAAAKKAARKGFDKWMLGIIKKGGTRAMGTIGAYVGSMGTAKATQPGTGKHGGTKTGKYNPKTGKYTSSKKDK